MAVTWDKILATLLPLLYSAIAWFLVRNPAECLIPGGIALPGFFVLFFYWMDPDFGMGWNNVYPRRPTPGIILALFAWLWLLIAPVVMLCRMWTAAS